MAIDNCEHLFDVIAQEHFPALFRDLDAKRENAVPSSVFTDNGYKAVLKALNLQKDFQGCYVFFERKTPMYVGISRKVIRRIRNHFTAINHHKSSLVYKMACEGKIIQLHRKKHKEEVYQQEFGKAATRLKGWSVIYLEVPCHVSLYLFEVYVAMRYDTQKYNSFKTH